MPRQGYWQKSKKVYFKRIIIWPFIQEMKKFAIYQAGILLISAISSSSPAVGQELQRWRFFHTPSKNIWCVYSNPGESLRCDVMNHAWKSWGRDNGGCFGHSFYLDNPGKSYAGYTSDSLKGSSESTVLKYGQRIKLDSTICESETTGLTCKNTSGGSLHLNREFYSLNK
ncbi:hypothetical protein PMIT1342_02137 [Prochlorococcus marinus str. MIT 1342]|nr:hypothetical protein PMIT1342_02137 [Prochlorococcus marinus str. MIT 1342]